MGRDKYVLFLLTYEPRNVEEKEYLKFLRNECFKDKICKELYEYALRLGDCHE